jgi:hypothetical protein
MKTTRRELLSLAAGAGLAIGHGMRPLVAQAPADDAALTERIRADLQKHAAFGDKFSGGPGDSATAEWIAGRLRQSGYRIEESDFPAPYLWFPRRRS